MALEDNFLIFCSFPSHDEVLLNHSGLIIQNNSYFSAMISKRCKYAIKALIYIAKNEDEKGSIFSSEIAEQENIPKKFLEGILRDLRNSQILISRRGVNGGYRLNHKPEEIALTDIIRLMDGPIALMPCVSLKYYRSCEECKEEEECSIRDTFLKVRDATLDIYNSTTLQDLSRF